MSAQVPAVDLAPTLALLGITSVLALLPLAWSWRRTSGASWGVRQAALAATVLTLAFELVVFGSFTRLTDSGLGCPDWPGCYGTVSAWSAREHIRAAEAAMPDGPVTMTKAWIEMIHRMLAMVVGALIVVMTVLAWRYRRAPGAPGLSPWWATATLAWVIVQGLFGKYTVTWKLQPAVVTLHLLGGLALLAMLAAQVQWNRALPIVGSPALRRGAWLALVVLGVQLALGGWVSTNYAVLACQGFPACNGQWWPAMDFRAGFEWWRPLGLTASGEVLQFPALVAIHMAHRLFAVVAAVALIALAVALRRRPEPTLRRYGLALAVLLAAQLASGLSNVVLGWPLLAALAHSAGAAALVALMASLLARLSASGPGAFRAGAAS